ncbi:ATPase, T2SS/T4P/T4SS family [Microvirga tunisiensis]|nr:ATPase, T2SS/T4P/T4SS family [Microvirga tunisiensis]
MQLEIPVVGATPILEIQHHEEQKIATIENSPTRTIIAHLLTPLMKWLEHSEVEEIQINRPTEIIQRLRKPLANGSLYAYHRDETLTRSYLTMLAHTMANSQDMANFGPQGVPVVYGTTPRGHRFVCGIGPNIQYDEAEISEVGSVCMVIRQFTQQSEIDLQDYGVTPGLPIERTLKSILNKDADPDDPYTKILNSLDRGDHILISGATGTGKTTLLRALMQKVDPNLRVVTVEDTRELVIPQVNRVHLLMARSGSANEFNYKSVVDLIVRMTPDIVLAGEISTSNAGAVWELMRSGHGHFMTTIHAESSEEAFGTFMTRISHTHENEVKDRDRLLHEMKKRLRVIQIQREGAKRLITEVV